MYRHKWELFLCMYMHMHAAYDGSLEFLDICLGNSNGKTMNLIQSQLRLPQGLLVNNSMYTVGYQLWPTFHPKHKCVLMANSVHKIHLNRSTKHSTLWLPGKWSGLVLKIVPFKGSCSVWVIIVQKGITFYCGNIHQLIQMKHLQENPQKLNGKV